MTSVPAVAYAPREITAITTAYHPDERLFAVVQAALESCSRVIVVDNTPAGEASLSDTLEESLCDPRVRVLRPGRNAGVAAALNLGLRELSAEADAVLFMDQDSVLTKELVTGLAHHLADPSVGVASPAPWDVTSDSHYESLSSVRYGEVSDRDAVITSGMLIRRSCLELVSEFREEFFCDYVDLDFCLRLRRAGVRIVQDKSLKLGHSIGDRREHRFAGRKVQVVHYPAWRHYWIARNGLILIGENRRTARLWSFATAVYLVRWVTVTAVFERSRRSHVGAFVKGLRDGARRNVTPTYLPAGADYSTDRG
jgi:rhamnosyltransferase